MYLKIKYVEENVVYNLFQSAYLLVTEWEFISDEMFMSD